MKINPDVQQAVQKELRSGERLLWADKPAKFPISFMAIYTFGFSILWTLIAISFVGAGAFASIVGSSAAETSGEAAGIGAFGAMFSVVSLVFVCIGVGMVLWGLKMLIGPSKELYALTDQRGLIISPFIKYRVVSLSPETLGNSERKGRPDRGTLSFKNSANNWMAMWMNPYQTDLSSFQNIENPKQVEDLIYNNFFQKHEAAS